eukprot:4224034-Ditylum_brightwellii.AAC.1
MGKNLLQNLEEKPGAYGTLKVLLKLQEKIWLVTDGSLDESIGYFEWVIASDRKNLWENCSHTQGEQEQIKMLQTKTIGLLWIVIFVQHYTRYYNICVDPDLLVHFCDDMGVVSQIQWAELQSVLTP